MPLLTQINFKYYRNTLWRRLFGANCYNFGVKILKTNLKLKLIRLQKPS